MSGLSKNKKKPKRHKLELELELFNIMVFFVWILKRVFFFVWILKRFGWKCLFLYFKNIFLKK